MSEGSMTEALENVLLRFEDAAPGDIKARLVWLEELALATSSAAAELGPPAETASLYLKAVLGAFVEFTKGGQGEEDVVRLHLSVQTLLAQALYMIYGALAETYRQLGKSDAPYRAECLELSRLWSSLQRTIKRGDPIRPEVLQKLEAIRRRVEDRSD